MLKVGIIGFGGMGHGHARRYVQRQDCELVAIADVRAGQLEGESVQLSLPDGTEADLSGVRTFIGGDEMLAAVKLDLVSVCLPTHLHAETAVKALEAGCHVLCEKPMARTLEGADRMIEARQRTGRLLMIGQCLRFTPCYEKLVEVHRSGEFGRLLILSMCRMGRGPLGADGWFKDGERSGGALLDLHVHDADMVHHLLGMPEGVFATGLTGDTGAIDTAVAQYVFPDGPAATVETSWSVAGGFRMSFRAVFERATLEIGYLDGALRLSRRDGDDTEVVSLSPESGTPREIDYFVECIHAGSEPERCLPFSTRESMRMVLAEEESALAGGRLVKLR